MKEEKKSPKDSRKIIGLFLLTSVISLAFYGSAEIPKIWQKISGPLVISNLTFQKKFDPAPALAEVENLTSGLQGAYGVYVYRLTDQKTYGVHQSETFPAASLMKLPVILTLYQEVEAGKLNLDDKPAGSTYSYRQLAERMGKYSDNAANNLLVKVLGAPKIQQTLDSLGMTKTSFKEYETTPEDVGIFFRKLYQDNLVNQAGREEILGFLTKTIFEDWLPAGVPVGTRASHKIGKDLGTFSDGGIVFGPKPFVLVVMSKFARESEAVSVLPKISKAVWEFETNGQAK